MDGGGVELDIREAMDNPSITLTTDELRDLVRYILLSIPPPPPPPPDPPRGEPWDGWMGDLLLGMLLCLAVASLTALCILRLKGEN